MFLQKIRDLEDKANRQKAHEEASRALRGEGDQTFGELAALDTMDPDGRMTYYSDVVARSRACMIQMNPQARVILEGSPKPRTRGSYVSEDDWIL